jgi:glucokinase
MNTAVILGIEIEDGLARAVLVDPVGAIVARAEHAGPEPADAAARAAGEALSAAGAIGPSAVGVAAVEPHARVWSPALEVIARAVGTAVSEPVLSCGGAAAVAEAWCGAGQGVEHLVAFSVGSRVSAGVVSGGTLLAGAHGLGGSVAWLALNPVEREDYRRMGCLEAEAGAAGIVRRLVWRIKAGDRSRVLDMAGGDLASITIDHVLKGARDGDGVAISVMRDTVKYLGMAISNIASVVDPEVVVLGGIMLSASDLLLEPIRLECARRMPPAMLTGIRIEVSTLDANAVAIGAARHAMTSGRPPAVGI